MNALKVFRSMEETSRAPGFLTDRHPVAKIIVTLGFLVSVAGIPKNDLQALFPFFFYPVIFLSLTAVSSSTLFLLLRIALIPVFFLGLIPVLLDGFASLQSWTVFIMLTLKVILTVTSTYLLAATTKASDLFSSFRRLGVPKIICLQLSLTWRYIDLMLEEVQRITKAHSLRSNGKKGIEPRLWGPLLGQLLLRSHARADRVYDAMRLRGFDGEYRADAIRHFGLSDAVFLLLCLISFIFFRIINVPLLLGNFASGGFF
jgi:cobalt/nickel transport system permease protein